MNLRHSHLPAILILTAVLAGPAAVATADRPNVVIVITDDQGYGDLSCHGNPILKTPNIDSLHKEAVRLTDYHVSPTCSPTRSAFLTGHWTNRTGVWHTIMGRSMLRKNEVTMGQMFKDAGYATGMFGKWHLGDNYPFRPEDRGFTEVLRHGGGGVGQTPDYWDNAYFDGSYFHNSKPKAVKGFCTDVFFSHAKDFIREQKKLGKPFFAYIATNAPHGPMHSPEEFSRPYAGKSVNLANFFGMIANIDDNVGKLREFLRAEGLAENTIFIFTTDNGTSSGSKVFNAGMRGAKGSEYDGGHRVPFFAYWPQGGIQGGVDVNAITAHVDVLPTLLDLCDVKATPGVKFDGVSLAPLLDPEMARRVRWADRMLITDSQRVKDPIKWRKSAVMSSQWRLVNGKELYAIQSDPGQQKNVAGDHPQVVAKMRAFYDDWWTELLPTFQQNAAIYLGHKAENPARLTCHDWITTGSTPWNQSHIRRALTGAANTGFWNVHVAEPGDYEVQLRRWPEEANQPIQAALPPGDDVPGVKPFRAEPGRAIQPVSATLTIGDVHVSQKVDAKMPSTTFQVALKAGPARLTALFETAEGTTYGAYYVHVLRKTK